MKIKLFLFLFLLTVSQNAFPQNSEIKTRPQAYLFSSGSGQTEPARREAYLFSGGSTTTRPEITRPRIVKIDEEKSSEYVDFAPNPNLSLERQAFDLINLQRARLNLRLLTWSDEIAKVARIHSENMANYNFFSHADLRGLRVDDRADIFGVRKWRAIGENIAYNRGYDNPVEFAVERWMKSTSHRENLLNNRWRESGIGIAVTKDGTYYFTEVFLQRK